MVIICVECGEVAKCRKTDGKYECVNRDCSNAGLTIGTQKSNELNGFTAIFCKLVGV